MSERPRGIETEKGRAPGRDKEMREQGLDRDAGSPAQRRRGKRGTEGPGKETDIPRRRKVLEGMSQPPAPSRPSGLVAAQVGSGEGVLGPPCPLPYPPQLSTLPTRVRGSPWLGQGLLHPQGSHSESNPGPNLGRGPQEERERSGAHSWPRRRLPRLLGVPCRRPPPLLMPAPCRAGSGEG